MLLFVFVVCCWLLMFVVKCIVSCLVVCCVLFDVCGLAFVVVDDVVRCPLFVI